MDDAATVEIPPGYMKDAMGRLIPEGMVSDLDKLRDQTVLAMVDRVREGSAALRALKALLMADVSAFVQLAFEKWEANIGGQKGNITLTSYDGRFQVRLAIAERLAFNEGIHAAKALVDECINAWSEGSRQEIRVLVQDAFQVDKAGTLATHRILSLLRLKIDDPTWKRAMKAIEGSITTVGSKSYIRVYERNGEGKFQPIPLDIAAV